MAEAAAEGDASARTKAGDVWLTQFYTQSFTIFTSLQSIAAAQLQSDGGRDANVWASDVGPSVQTMQYYHRIGVLYTGAIRTYLDTLEADSTEASEYLLHIQSLHTIFQLAQVLYFPEDGRGMGVVGEELLHWLNAHDGQQIAQTSPSFDHPEYWDYLFRCVLRGFYGTAATVLQSYHAPGVAPTLSSIAKETAQILKTLPRSTAYGTEHAFFAAHRSWHTSVRVFLSSLQRKMDSVQKELETQQAPHAEEERLELEAQFRCLLELLSGVQERVLEFAENWTEAVCAWGTLVQPTMKRDDLPDVMQLILGQLPLDGTLGREVVLAAIMQGDVTKAIKQCLAYDEWLAAHLGDYCNKAQLLDAAPDDDGVSLGDTTLFAWADTLLEEERLWRMALSYLAEVPTTAARSKMRAILFSVPLMDDDMDADTQFQRVEEVLSACIEYGMDDEVRIICNLMEHKKYGLAIAYSVRARDARQVRTIADHMLHDYVALGPAAFIRSVDTIPRMLLDNAETIATEAGLTAENAQLATPFATTSSIFSTDTFAPLVFHVKYRDFHELYADSAGWAEAATILVGLLTSDVTPESFLTVLLVDALPLIQAPELFFTQAEAYELLRVVEKVASFAGASTTGDVADYYFYWLEQLLEHQPGNADKSVASRRELAQEQMLMVRLALSKYLARVLVQGTEPR